MQKQCYKYSKNGVLKNTLNGHTHYTPSNNN